MLEYDGTSGAIQRWYAYGLDSNDVLNQTSVAAGRRMALIPDIQGSLPIEKKEPAAMKVAKAEIHRAAARRE